MVHKNLSFLKSGQCFIQVTLTLPIMKIMSGSMFKQTSYIQLYTIVYCNLLKGYHFPTEKLHPNLQISNI
jgi:hypothetical protein